MRDNVIGFDLKSYHATDALHVLKAPYHVYVYFVVSGNCTIMKNNKMVNLKAGEVLAVFEYDQIQLLSHACQLLCLSFNQTIYYKYCFATPSLSENTKSTVSLKQAFLHSIFALNQSDIKHIHTTIQILCRHIHAVRMGELTALTYASTLIQDVIHYINRDAEHITTCQMIARQFYVNNSYLSRQFSYVMHVSLKSYLKTTKIHRAVFDLFDGKPLKQLWRQYHYTSEKAFSKHFEDVIHCSPRTFLTTHLMRAQQTLYIDQALLQRLQHMSLMNEKS
ncbi:helix-turn-helix domain-containing protein [Staphylococcus auricularis]|uniref:helix-turn-helix domain-containing protein n=1 Tax=Staphylococcus auricularis TaxID=29379 RepID=UPI001EF31BC3|nr:helix-turn-helix domain-containing protein [Staphylococcus auricularis]MCG7341592.1 helix-turn-helix domain-containing protein [Staphylococcus auricularis]